MGSLRWSTSPGTNVASLEYVAWRHTARQVFERLRAEHEFGGRYTIVKDAVRAWREPHREVFLPLSHPPGEAQVDFGEAMIRLAGQETKVALFVMRSLTREPSSSRRFLGSAPRHFWKDTAAPSSTSAVCRGGSVTTTRPSP